MCVYIGIRVGGWRKKIALEGEKEVKKRYGWGCGMLKTGNEQAREDIRPFNNKFEKQKMVQSH